MVTLVSSRSSQLPCKNLLLFWNIKTGSPLSYISINFFKSLHLCNLKVTLFNCKGDRSNLYYIKIKSQDFSKNFSYKYWHKIPSKVTKSPSNTNKIGQHQNDSSINVSVTKRPCKGSWTCQHETCSEPVIELFNIIDHKRTHYLPCLFKLRHYMDLSKFTLIQEKIVVTSEISFSWNFVIFSFCKKAIP